ncbi:MAG: AAA family ATPase [Bacteroidetes bacterium]|nr:AAA family ATPase [Bacteroidota bacterium]
MKLFIHDKCMERLIELPKAIAKKVLEFNKKFRENSRSEAIHLEPIITFKDSSLRTARIDQKYRAIIGVASGDNYHLLWVDNHDEAMDWAKNKVFEWNENTQIAQIYSMPNNIDVNVLRPENVSNVLFSNYSDIELINIGVPVTLIELVKGISDLKELEAAEKFLPNDAFENLFYLSEGISITQLISEINDGKSSSINSEDQLNSNNNKRYFVEVDDLLMDEIINGDFVKWQTFLHPTQRQLVESNFKGSVKVSGGAGTGKTVAALHRLKKLSSEQDKTDFRKIIFITFTNALTKNLKNLANKLSIDNSKVIITNIDSLVKELALNAKITTINSRILDMYNSKSSAEVWDEILENNLSEFEVRFLSAEYQNVILYNDVKTLDVYLNTSRIGRGKPLTRKQKIDIWTLVEKYKHFKQSNDFFDRYELFNLLSNYNDKNEIKPFKHVIADEIQDLSNVELRLLRSLVEVKENDMFLVGDPYQKIYDKKINFSSVGISIRGNRSKQLRINYRTSEEIKKLAISTIKGINYDDFDGEQEKLVGYLSVFHGERPIYEIFSTKGQEIDFVIENLSILKDTGLNLNAMAIGSRTKDGLKDIKTLLHKLKIPYNDITTSSSNDSDGIVLSTFHGLKGLEFKALFLIDVNNRTCPLIVSDFYKMDENEKTEYISREKSLIYVAMTRAITFLMITGTGIKSDSICI